MIKFVWVLNKIAHLLKVVKCIMWTVLDQMAKSLDAMLIQVFVTLFGCIKSGFQVINIFLLLDFFLRNVCHNSFSSLLFIKIILND